MGHNVERCANGGPGALAPFPLGVSVRGRGGDRTGSAPGAAHARAAASRSAPRARSRRFADARAARMAPRRLERPASTDASSGRD